jgi:hypothetical protein
VSTNFAAALAKSPAQQALLPSERLSAAIGFARPRAAFPWAGAVHSEAGAIPALSRNGDAWPS